MTGAGHAVDLDKMMNGKIMKSWCSGMVALGFFDKIILVLRELVTREH